MSAPQPYGRDGAVVNTKHPRANSPWLRLALFVLAVAAAVYGASSFGLFRLGRAEHLAAAIRGARNVPGLPVLFVLAYAAASTFGLPATAFTLAGGAIFGLVLGTLLNWLGATAGAVGAYALARRLGSDAVQRLLGKHARVLDTMSAHAGFATILRLRLLPLAPFNGINIAAGFARAPFRDYVLATAIGILPGTIVYTYFANSLIAGVSGARHRALLNVAISGGLLILLSFAPAVWRRVRRR